MRLNYQICCTASSVKKSVEGYSFLNMTFLLKATKVIENWESVDNLGPAKKGEEVNKHGIYFTAFVAQNSAGKATVCL